MGEKGMIVVPDTNVFIHDPNSVETLRADGCTLAIPWAVMIELNGLKNRPDISLDARDVTERIEKIRLSSDPTLIIKKNPRQKYLENLDKADPDHQIIATALELQKDKNNKNPVQLLSRDRMVRVLGRELGVVANDYCREQADAPKFQLKRIDVESKDIVSIDEGFPYSPDIYGSVEKNEGVVCTSEKFLDVENQQFEMQRFAAVRKGDFFQIIDPNINAIGLRPFTLNGEPNWSQYIALYQLLDPSISLVFLQGGAGTGKTLLALATAIGQRKECNQIIVTRPMVHLEDEDRMGFLPGGTMEKMSPWLTPIHQALNFLKENPETRDHKSVIENVEGTHKIDFLPLDYIRGMTFSRCRLIIDDAQNLTPHQIKTIITRAGMGTKVVFTGDVGQIDRRRRLDERSSGLAYAMNRMRNRSLVGVTTFKETVRSPLAKLAEEEL